MHIFRNSLSSDFFNCAITTIGEQRGRALNKRTIVRVVLNFLLNEFKLKVIKIIYQRCTYFEDATKALKSKWKRCRTNVPLVNRLDRLKQLQLSTWTKNSPFHNRDLLVRNELVKLVADDAPPTKVTNMWSRLQQEVWTCCKTQELLTNHYKTGKRTLKLTKLAIC